MPPGAKALASEEKQMYPGIFWWMRHHRRRHGGCAEARPGMGPEQWAMGGEDEFGGGGSFGVRRPLRFLAWKLELDEAQVAELAKILDELKTERAQAAVDARRTVAAFADAIA